MASSAESYSATRTDRPSDASATTWYRGPSACKAAPRTMWRGRSRSHPCRPASGFGRACNPVTSDSSITAVHLSKPAYRSHRRMRPVSLSRRTAQSFAQVATIPHAKTPPAAAQPQVIVGTSTTPAVTSTTRISVPPIAVHSGPRPESTAKRIVLMELSSTVSYPGSDRNSVRLRSILSFSPTARCGWKRELDREGPPMARSPKLEGAIAAAFGSRVSGLIRHSEFGFRHSGALMRPARPMPSFSSAAVHPFDV